jgi:hypothetical protein
MSKALISSSFSKPSSIQLLLHGDPLYAVAGKKPLRGLNDLSMLLGVYVIGFAGHLTSLPAKMYTKGNLSDIYRKYIAH